MVLDPQVVAVLELIRKAGSPEYWQMTPQQARDWHNQKSGILDIKPAPVFRVEDRRIPGPVSEIQIRIYTPRSSHCAAADRHLRPSAATSSTIAT
jgi:acetyl esterase